MKRLAPWISVAVCFLLGLGAVTLAWSWMRRPVAAPPAEPRPAGAEVEAHLARTEEYLAVGNIIAAHAEGERARALAPEDPRVFAILGNVAYQSLRKAAAEGYYRRAAELEPNLAMAHGNLALVSLDMGLSREAAEAARRALAIEPGHPFYQALLGRSLLLQGEPQGAAPALEAAVQGGFAPAQKFLGRARDLLGQGATALEDFDRALAADPTDAQAHFWRAECLRRLGRHDEAKAAFAEYTRHSALHLRVARLRELLLVKDPDNVDLLLELAGLLLDQGAAKDAVGPLGRAEQLAPGHPEARRLRARLPAAPQ
jgi:tetratricopeptide (TPR) repeat protein